MPQMQLQTQLDNQALLDFLTRASQATAANPVIAANTPTGTKLFESPQELQQFRQQRGLNDPLEAALQQTTDEAVGKVQPPQVPKSVQGVGKRGVQSSRLPATNEGAHLPLFIRIQPARKVSIMRFLTEDAYN
jgi:hypothetical protein